MAIWNRIRRLVGLASCALVLGLSAPAASAQGILHELKIGGLYHDSPELWSGFQLERRSIDINVEALFGPHIDLLWGAIRPMVGATISTVGATSKAYAGARWEIETNSGLFFGLGLGGAVHDGKLRITDVDRKALGSRLLFHIPIEVGWRWDGHNSLSFYFEHSSNAYTQDHNEGLDGVGMRYGYRF